MIKSRLRLIPCFLILSAFSILLSACGSQQNSNTLHYKEMKTMVIDILKSEEAKEAIEEVTKKEGKDKENDSKILRMLSTPEGQQIRMAVKEVLTDPQYSEVLKPLMTDPKFAGEFAKSVQKENKQIHKELMKDPEYQKLLIDVMKSSDFEKIMIDILKSKEYRQQSMTILQDALNNPIFRLEMMELMKKAMEEQSKPKSEKKKDQGSSEISEDGEEQDGDAGSQGQ